MFISGASVPRTVLFLPDDVRTSTVAEINLDIFYHTLDFRSYVAPLFVSSRLNSLGVLMLMLLLQDLQKTDTCGFCGAGSCKTWIVVRKGRAAPQIHSTCTLAPRVDPHGSAVDVGLKSASKSTTSTPCTNVPLKFLFCEPDRWVWKYCMSYHVEDKHASLVALWKNDPVTETFKASYE